MVSTTDIDMIGDVVLPEGMDTGTYFESTRSVNLDHAPDAPVGTCRQIKPMREKGVWCLTYVGKHQLGEDVFTMLREQVIRGMSIEWDPRSLVAGPPSPQEVTQYGACKRVFRKWTLTSYAFTAQPMNPYCTVDGIKSMQPGSAALKAMEETWHRLRKLVDGNKITVQSAKSAGLPAKWMTRKESTVLLTEDGGMLEVSSPAS